MGREPGRCSPCRGWRASGRREVGRLPDSNGHKMNASGRDRRGEAVAGLLCVRASGRADGCQSFGLKIKEAGRDRRGAASEEVCQLARS